MKMARPKPKWPMVPPSWWNSRRSQKLPDVIKAASEAEAIAFLDGE